MKIAPSKCSKKRNEYCRIHNPEPKGFTPENRRRFIMQGIVAYRAQQATNSKPACVPEAESYAKQDAEQASLENDKLTQEHAYRVADLDKHMNLKVNNKTGERTISVYRAGVPQAPSARTIEKESYLTADSHAPEGRQGRMSAVFASPTMHGVTAWVRGTSSVVSDWGVREIRVNPDEVYVYSVRAWEKASREEANRDSSKKYWATGITLTEWNEKLRSDPQLDPQEWELLIGESQFKAQPKPVAAEKVARSSYSSDNGEPNLNLLLLLTRDLKKRKQADKAS